MHAPPVFPNQDQLFIIGFEAWELDELIRALAEHIATKRQATLLTELIEIKETYNRQAVLQ